MSLEASSLPLGAACQFVYGTSAAQLPFGAGNLCVAGAIFRLASPVASDRRGVASQPVPFEPQLVGEPAGQIQVGSTWYVQAWYRDAGALNVNFTDALEITFLP